MKLKIVMICFFFLSCSNTHSYNFDKLTFEFEHWYNSLINTEISKYILDNNKKNELINDLKRFKFEFSQINSISLNLNDRLYYNVINDKIDELFLKHEKNNYSGFDPSIIFEDIYKHLFEHLCSKKYLNIDSFLLSLDTIKKQYKNIHPGSFYRIESSINKSILLINDFIAIESDYNHTDEIIKIKNNLNNIKMWFNENVTINKDIVNKNKINIYNSKTQNILSKNSGYNYNDIMKFIESKIISLQNKIFDISLPIYLKNNDEPIWIDRQDSLNIINNVLINESNDLFFNDFENCDKNIKSQSSDTCSTYNLSIHIDELFNILNKHLDINNEYVDYNLGCFNNNNYRLYDSYEISSNYLDYNIDDKFSINANSIENMLIIENYYLPFLKSKSLFEIESSDFALKDIFFRIIIDELSTNNKQIDLFYYINKLRLMTKILTKNEYVFNDITESDGIKFLISNGFYNNKTSKLAWKEIIYPDNYYLDKYLASVKLNEVYDEFCIINNTYTNKEFILKIMNFHSIPFYMFNKFIN